MNWLRSTVSREQACHAIVHLDLVWEPIGWAYFPSLISIPTTTGITDDFLFKEVDAAANLLDEAREAIHHLAKEIAQELVDTKILVLHHILSEA